MPGRSSERGMKATPSPASTAAAQRSSLAERSTARGRLPAAASRRVRLVMRLAIGAQDERRVGELGGRPAVARGDAVLGGGREHVGLAQQDDAGVAGHRLARRKQRQLAAAAPPALHHDRGGAFGDLDVEAEAALRRRQPGHRRLDRQGRADRHPHQRAAAWPSAARRGRAARRRPSRARAAAASGRPRSGRRGGCGRTGGRRSPPRAGRCRPTGSAG